MSTRSHHDVAVIGAGPYGLACTSHLRARGLDAHALGRPMDLWEERMPAGMLLRSSWDASTIADPDGALSLDAFEARRGEPLPRPIPLEDYLAYGRWYQRSAVPDLDTRRVARLHRLEHGFELELDDGDTLAAGRVVVATGPGDFPRRPARFAEIPAPLARHSSELRELDAYRGRRTAVVGAGQSAIELAALLHEAGADVEIIARADRIRWLRRSGWLHRRDGVFRRMLYPRTDVGPVGLAWLVAVPGGFRHVPTTARDRIAYRCIRPAASGWLGPRTAEVRITLARSIVSAVAADDRVRLQLDDGGVRDVERVVLATGFDIAVGRHPLMSPELLAALRTRAGSPALGAGLESSVPGLHFAGAFAAPSFGPVMRFVSGTPFAARALAAHVARSPRAATLPARPAPVTA
jgi:FAD-dependent urate hydroxylase